MGDQNKYDALKPLHRALVMMLDDFAQICKEEDLRWYGSFGTAIGALREGGFIPWDEDIDICMMRKDLEKLTKAVQEKWSHKYEMIDSTINPYYPMTTSRIMLKGTICADESLSSMNFTSGIFLDLFPMDDLSDNEKEFNRQVKRAWLYNKLAIAKLTAHPYIKDDGMKSKVLRVGTIIARKVLNLPGVRNVDWNAKSVAISTACAGEATRRVGYLCDTGIGVDIYERDDFEPARWVPFENTMIPIAAKAEKQLDAFYGDWRTPVDESLRDEHFPEVLLFGPYAKRFEAEK